MKSQLLTKTGLSKLLATAGLLLCLLAPAQASVVFEFVGVVERGFLESASPVALVGLDGLAVTVRGRTISDIDANPGDAGLGAFAAATTFDFGSAGTFVADPGSTFLLQGCFPPNAFNCTGVSFNLPTLTFGFAPGIPTVNADPNVLQALGQPSPTFVVSSNAVPMGGGTLRNAAGERMDLTIRPEDISFISVVPAPLTLPLLAIGLTGMALRRRSLGA